MIKTRNSLSGGLVVSSWKTSSTGFTQVTTPSVLGTEEYIDSYYGPRKPRFSINPVVIRQAVGSCTVGDVEAYQTNWPSYTFRLSGPFAVHNTFTKYYGDINQELQILTRNKAHAKILDGDFESVVFIGEFKETLELIRHPLRQFLKLLSSRSGREAISGSASAWLQIRYGVMPLYNDIMAALALLSKLDEPFENKVQSKRAGKVNTISSTNRIATGFDGWYWDVVEQTQLEVKSTSIVYYQWALNAEMRLRQQLGFLPQQIPSAMWNLVTLSFVLDWVFKVGNWISAITPNPSLTMLGACTSQVLDAKKTASIQNLVSTYRTIRSSTLPVATWHSRTLVRLVDPTQPAYRPALDPQFLNLLRTVDSLALLISRVLQVARKR